MPKLFHASLEVHAYFLAADEQDARRHAARYLSEEMRNYDGFDADIRELAQKPAYLEANWERGALVYGAKDDTTLGSVLDALPDSTGAGRVPS